MASPGPSAQRNVLHTSFFALRAGMKPSSITHSIFLRLQTQSNLAPLPEDLALKPRLYQRNGYKGNVRASKAQPSRFFFRAEASQGLRCRGTAIPAPWPREALGVSLSHKIEWSVSLMTGCKGDSGEGKQGGALRTEEFFS